MKLKSLLTSALALCSAFAMSAQDYLHSLKVEKTDGTIDTYLFVDKPEITFEGRVMRVTSSVASTSYRLKEVAQYFFGEYSGIETVAADEVRFEVVAPGVVNIVSQSPVGTVNVYDLQGRAVDAKIAAEGTAVTVDVTALAPGFYILNTPNNSIKIRR